MTNDTMRTLSPRRTRVATAEEQTEFRSLSRCSEVMQCIITMRMFCSFPR